MKNLSRKKRRKKKNRAASAKDWIAAYTGEDIVASYSKWYGVELLCAIKELRMNGIQVTEAYEQQVKETIKANKQARKLKRENIKKRKLEKQNTFSDDRFAFIAGYTSGGAAFGITHEEMKYNLEEDREEDMDNDLPF